MSAAGPFVPKALSPAARSTQGSPVSAAPGRPHASLLCRAQVPQ